jgi:hypothetical protein
MTRARENYTKKVLEKCTRRQKKTKGGQKVSWGAGRKQFNPTGFTIRAELK